MHSLDDISTVIEHTADVLRIDSAGEVRVTVVLDVTRRRRNTEELVPDKVLGPDHLHIIIKKRINFGEHEFFVKI